MLAGEFMPYVVQRADLVGGPSDVASQFSGYPIVGDQWLIAGKALGAKVASQRLSVVAFAYRADSNALVASATIGGVACSVHNGPSISSGARYSKSVFMFAETGGLGVDTADIAINFNTGHGVECSLGVMVPYRICGLPVLPYHRNQTQGSGATQTVNHKILKGGISIAIGTISGESWGDFTGFSPAYTLDVNNLEIGDIIRFGIGWRQPAANFDANTSALFSAGHDQTLHVISF